MKRALAPLALVLPAVLACGTGGETPPVEPPPPGRTALTLGTPRAGNLRQGRVDSYTVAVTRGQSYVVSLTSLTDSALGLRVDNAGTVQSNVQTAAPKDYTLQAAGTPIRVDVEAASLVKPSGDYVVTVVPAPVVTTPIVGTSGDVPARTPTVGWVETRSTSRYRTTGLAAGSHTVSIVGLTSAADLHVYADGTYSMELDCTLRHAGAREFTVPGQDAYFAVTAGGVNRDGAGYVILVW
jgi:hypothetical protein